MLHLCRVRQTEEGNGLNGLPVQLLISALVLHLSVIKV